MPRRTPVRELQEENGEEPLRRSSRIAQSSPGPTKITQRRNSSSNDTPVKITKSRRLSLSQENSEPAENKSETNAADPPKRTRSTRSVSKSPTLLAKELETKGTPVKIRTRRGSKTLDEEDTSSESSLQKGRSRSTRSESKSPTTIKDVEPSKSRPRRGSITERVVALEKIEEVLPSTPELKKRVRGRRSSLTEMSQLNVIEETEVCKKELMKPDLETISEAKENDEKDSSIVIVPDSPECKEKANSGQEKDKFRMSPVVVIQKSKVIADLTTTQNSENESVAGVKETKDDLIEAMKLKETVNESKIDGDQLSPIIAPEQQGSENVANDRRSDGKKETKCVIGKDTKVEEESSITSSSLEPSTVLNNPVPKAEDKSTAENDAKVEEDFPIISNNLDPSTSSDSAIKKIQNGYSEDKNKSTEEDTKMKQELSIISSTVEPSTSSDSAVKKTQNSDFEKESGKSITGSNPKMEELPVISSNLVPATTSDSGVNEIKKSDSKKVDTSITKQDAKIQEEFPNISSNLEPPTSSDGDIKTQNLDSKIENKSITQQDIKANKEFPIISSNLEPSTSSDSDVITQNLDSKIENQSITKQAIKANKEFPIISSNLEPSTSSNSDVMKTQNSDSKKEHKSITKKDTKAENQLAIISSNLESSTSSDGGVKKTQNSNTKREDKSVTKKYTKAEEEPPIISSNLEPSTSSDGGVKKTQNADSTEKTIFVTKQDTRANEEFPIISNTLETSTIVDKAKKKTDSSSEESTKISPTDDDKNIEENNEKSDNQLKEAFGPDPSDIKKTIVPLAILPIDKKELDKIEKPNVNKERQCMAKKLIPMDEVILKNLVVNDDSSLDQNGKNDVLKINGPELDKASGAKETIVPPAILPIDKKELDKIEKPNLNKEMQCMAKTLIPRDELILKNLVVNADTSVDHNRKNDVSKINGPELDKTATSENVVNVSGGKELVIDLERIEADVLTNKSLNTVKQSTPVNNDNLKEKSIRISDKELLTSKNLNKEFSTNSKTSPSEEGICNKSLTSLLPNQLEMTSGSDGSFNIKLSLQHVEEFTSQEELSDYNRSKEDSLTESEAELSKSKNDMSVSASVSEKNTLVNISPKPIEQTREILKKQVDDSFSEPMDVDDPSLLHIDDSPISKSAKLHTNLIKKDSISVLDIQENTEESKNTMCETSDTQLEINKATPNKSEQTSKGCHISKNELKCSEILKLDLEEKKLNKTDSFSKRTEESDQINLEKGVGEPTELNTTQADNSDNTKSKVQAQQPQVAATTIENIDNKDSSGVSDLVNESVSLDEKDNEEACLSPTFSINSADIAEESDEDDIVKDTPKKQNREILNTELSADMSNASPIAKQIEDSIVTTELVNVGREMIEDNISDVVANPNAEENAVDDIDATIGIKKHCDKISNEKQIQICLSKETKNSTTTEPPNKTEDDSEKLMDANSKGRSNSPKTTAIELENNDSEPTANPNQVEEKSRTAEQVSSTTPNEIKSKEFKTDMISKTIETIEANVNNTSGSNRDVNNDSLNNCDDDLHVKSNKDEIDTNSVAIPSTKEKDSDEDQPGDVTNISPKEQKLKLSKSKTKKKTKVDTNESVETNHSTEENEKDGSESLKKKKKKKKASKSSHKSSFDETVENFIEETVKECTSSSEDENNVDEESNNVFIDDMAEEGEEDTPSEGSNDIPCDGESINSSDTYTEEDDDNSYEADSFIDDDGDKYELLSGEENFLQDEQTGDLKKTEAKRKSISPQKQMKKRKRIITVSESDDEETSRHEQENVVVLTDSNKTRRGDTQIESKLTAEYKEAKAKKDTSEDSAYSNEKEINVDIPTEFLPSKDDVIHVDSESSNESETSHSVDRDELNKDVNSAAVENRSNRKSSITIQENIKLEDIEDGELSDRISKVVDWFYTGIRNNSDTGNISLNVSLDYADLPPNEENSVKEVDTDVKLEDKSASSSRESKKRKSDDFIQNESPKRTTYETIVDEVFGDGTECSKDGKSPKPKLSKKSKRKSMQKENQKDEILNAVFTSAEGKLISGKPRKEHSHKFDAVENLNENQLKPDSKVASKRLSDDKINYLSPKRVKQGTAKAGKTNKHATVEEGSNIIKDITSTINKKKNIENDISGEVFIENDVIETDKPRKIKKSEKVEQVSDDIANVIITRSTVRSNDLIVSKKKKTKKAKEVSFSDEDNTNADSDFHSVSSKAVNKPVPYTRNISEINDDFNVEVASKKNKKLKRLSYPTRKTEIPCSSGILKQQFISNTFTSKSEVAKKQERRKKLKLKTSQRILPSKNTDLNDSWESEIFDMNVHPSKSNRKHIDAGTSKKKKTEIDSFSSKDFKNRMLYDASRVKRMATKVLLRQRKGL